MVDPARHRFERIVPGHPEQNGAHERMHRTLKAETTRPPEQTMDRQQRFDEFRSMFNNERPHETLGQKRPATIYRPSPWPYPSPCRHRVRRPPRDAEDLPQRHDALEARADLHEQNTHRRLGRSWVGLEEIDDGIWSLYYGPVLLARFDEREMRFYG